MQAGEGSGSFWEPGNYQRTTQRITDGQRLCKEMVSLLKERAEVEKTYAKELHAWVRKWRELVQGGPQHGATEALWEAILTEGEKLGDLHLKMRDKLCNDIIKGVKGWSKESYQKSMLQIKVKKEVEESFKNAQKPWEKLLNKVEDAKAEYHTAFRKERSAFNQLRNAYGDPDLSLSQVKKIQDRSVQCKENLSTAKEKYEATLDDVVLYKSKYIEDMTAVFDKCQEMEAERLYFFQKIMFAVQKCFDLSQNPTFQQIYEEFYAAIDDADPEKDLEWWSQNHGTLMEAKWPTFEEYQEGCREIVKRKSNTEVASGTTLTNWKAVGEDAYESSLRSEMPAQGKTDSSGKEKKETETGTEAFAMGPVRSTNPFYEYESDNGTCETFIDFTEAGIKVKALYDYEAKDIDELNFKEGEIFDKLDEPDEQGWCRGRKDGRIGLYPASYVEIVD